MNFYYEESRTVFIHIKKAGGSSIRKALAPLGKAKTAFGCIPDTWHADYTFCVVRNPLDRFLSAINMFKLGVLDSTEVIKDYNTPSLPNITISGALDILEDPKIEYTRMNRRLEDNLKHHLWPQTEPFFCLSHANEILEYEKIQEGFLEVAKRLGIKPEIEWVRRTANHPQALKIDSFSSSDIVRFMNIYQSDYTILGYEPPVSFTNYKKPHNAIISPKSDIFTEIARDPCVAAWRYYFECSGTNELMLSEALPEASVDLSIFNNSLVEVKKQNTWPGRDKNILDHFRSLEPEFSGQPRLNHLLACIIVVLRRDPHNKLGLELFFKIVTEYGIDLANSLNIRWLSSVCDTLVDVGRNGEERAIAALGSSISALVKLSETERRVYYPRIPWPPRLKFSRGGHMYEGVIGFSPEKGDMIENLLGRLNNVLHESKPASIFSKELVTRLSEKHSTISRFKKITGEKNPHMASDDLSLIIKEAIKEEGEAKERNSADEKPAQDNGS
ncbi:sulfotransferase family protein [Paracoccus gahaiensis]|uniref:Sulfotransferase family protein n=1 Tax=Paracoccus gahaiensis TaxID=1706839 RepID=A0A4U0R2T1_9RHOB|nr:sulfotransferase family 2 domain-containing protein [Paracoccus gahaiensis]TJZ88866.1 sulfotransferase family protein [Paracoccus gahaiensis]